MALAHHILTFALHLVIEGSLRVPTRGEYPALHLFAIDDNSLGSDLLRHLLFL